MSYWLLCIFSLCLPLIVRIAFFITFEAGAAQFAHTVYAEDERGNFS